jgi:hypothetical protein
MGDRRVPGAHRVQVAEEPLLDGGRYDYADAFEIHVPEPDTRTAEQWVRRGLEGAPSALRGGVVVVHRYLLGFRLGPLSAPDHVLGWRIVTSQPDVVLLEAVSPLGRGVIVGRRPDPGSTVLTTFLFRTRPVPARIIWAFLGPVHRRIAPYLLERAAAAGQPR